MKTKKRGTFKYLFFYYNCQLLIVNYQLLSLRLLHCPYPATNLRFAFRYNDNTNSTWLLSSYKVSSIVEQ